MGTHRSGVDKDHEQNDEDDENNGSDDVPLVELPDDVLEGLERRGEPGKRRGRTSANRRQKVSTAVAVQQIITHIPTEEGPS